MANPSANPAPPADPTPPADSAPLATPDDEHDNLAVCLEQLERDMYQQSWWVEEMLSEPWVEIREMRDTISQLSERIEDLKAYLRFQCGGQPIVMDCGPGTQLHYIRGGPSWR
jgi:hypothetical protein